VAGRIASVAIFLLGVRAFSRSGGSLRRVRLPMHTDNETVFVRIYERGPPFSVPSHSPSSRFAWSNRSPCSFTLATVLPLLDAVVIVSRVGVGHELLRHAAILYVSRS